MQPRSSSSAAATYLDRAQRVEEVRRAARRAASRLASIQRVILFGSLVGSTPTPRSDADLLVIVSASQHAEPSDRIPEILRAFSPLPCPMDVFVLTVDEFGRFEAEGSPLVRTVRRTGLDLLSDDRPRHTRRPPR